MQINELEPLIDEVLKLWRVRDQTPRRGPKEDIGLKQATQRLAMSLEPFFLEDFDPLGCLTAVERLLKDLVASYGPTAPLESKSVSLSGRQVKRIRSEFIHWIDHYWPPEYMVNADICPLSEGYSPFPQVDLGDGYALWNNNGYLTISTTRRGFFAESRPSRLSNQIFRQLEQLVGILLARGALVLPDPDCDYFLSSWNNSRLAAHGEGSLDCADISSACLREHSLWLLGSAPAKLPKQPLMDLRKLFHEHESKLRELRSDIPWMDRDDRWFGRHSDVLYAAEFPVILETVQERAHVVTEKLAPVSGEQSHPSFPLELDHPATRLANDREKRPGSLRNVLDYLNESPGVLTAAEWYLRAFITHDVDYRMLATAIGSQCLLTNPRTAHDPLPADFLANRLSHIVATSAEERGSIENTLVEFYDLHSRALIRGERITTEQSTELRNRCLNYVGQAIVEASRGDGVGGT